MIIFGYFVTRPDDSKAPNESQGDMSIILGSGPIARLTHFNQMVRCPILAVLARPGLCSIARTAYKHEFSGVQFACWLTGDLKRDTMIDLQIAEFIFRETNTTTRAIKLHQGSLKALRPRLATTKFSAFDLGRIAESICTYFSAMCSSYAKRFQRNALLPHVTCGSRRVIIPVSFVQLFSCDGAMLQNVIDYSLRTLCGDSS